MSIARIAVLTTIAMIAFAGNSLRYRLALSTATGALLMPGAGGVVVLGEPVTLRLGLASAAIPGGVAVFVSAGAERPRV